MSEAKNTGKTRRRAITLGGGLVVALGLMFGVKTGVAEVYRVPVQALEPELPVGSRVLVYKLADSFSPGQIVVYRHTSGQAYLGRVIAHDPGNFLSIERNGTGAMQITERDVIGRVVLNTR